MLPQNQTGTGQGLLSPIAGFVTIIIIIAGLTGNLITIGALIKFPKVRNVAAAFIVSLCVADALFCVLVLPFNAIKFLTGSFGVSNPTICKIVPFLQYSNVGLSLLFITMITINRYVMIANYQNHNRIYKTEFVIAMIISCIILSFGMQVPTLLSVWGKYEYVDRLGGCSITEDDWGRSSKTSLFIIGFVIPCVIIIACYARIFWVVHKSETKMANHANRDQKLNNLNQETRIKTRESKHKRNEWRVTKMVLAIFISFLLCYLPITIVKVADSQIHFPSLHIVSYLMLYASACINPIIYVIMNKQYRRAYINLLNFKSPKRFVNSSADRNSKTLTSNVVSISLAPIRNGMNHGS